VHGNALAMGKVNGDSSGGGMVMERSKLEKNDSLVNLNLWQREPKEKQSSVWSMDLFVWAAAVEKQL
jgi:hypothetical protein